jgi:membrane fusion protein, multidrug efflux system
VTFHGEVVGVDAGTGSAFALLPPQNATGNWIKVVQRVPVRVSISPNDIQVHPLRVGLSMEVSVDTSVAKRSVAGDPPADPEYVTSVYDQRLQGAASLIAAIVRENLLPGSESAIASDNPVEAHRER